MKSIKSIFYSLLFAAVLAVPMTSCKDYLDKAPGSDIGDADAYGDWTSAQGAVEALYWCVTDPDKGGAWNNYSFADENLGPNQYPFDLGNYWNASTYFSGGTVDMGNTEPRGRRIWEWAWYAIRQANVILEHLDPTDGSESVFHGTAEEKNLIKGQTLFWRAWFYFDICRYWGGMPYITKVIGAAEDMTTEEFNRLSFTETAKLMAKDFHAAAELLPINWDETVPGKITEGKNQQRVNWFWAKGYEGKALLYAASPMMQEDNDGRSRTCYEFDGDLCKQAAEVFSEVIKKAADTKRYELQDWNNYLDMFYMWNYNLPGGKEVIMKPTLMTNRVRWSALGGTVPAILGMNSGSSGDAPTHNIVKNFFMANGLPIGEPDSGYDEQHPWDNRDPRFYKTIIKHGDRITQAGNGLVEIANMEVGGQMRTQSGAPNPTGYYQSKFNGLGDHFTANNANQLQAFVPYLRLSDIYLMYAEAVNFMTGGGPTAQAGPCGLTAVQAQDAIRTRCGLPGVDARFTASKEKFFDNLIIERAVELFMEGARFCDLRRWNLNYDPKYLDKTAIDFNLDGAGNPVNFSERVVITRTAAKKHNWLPITVKYTKMYAGFPQNPGW